MQWVVHAKDGHRLEFISALKDDSHIHWIRNAEEFKDTRDAELYIDLGYEHTSQRLKILETLQAPIVVNSVIHTLNEIPFATARINAWPGFLGNNIEAAGNHQGLPASFQEKLRAYIKWVDDIPGFISARVIALIINEAYLAYDEGISSKEDIDTAMKLGTNYPFGPFEWSRKLGLIEIHSLLSLLSKKQSRYIPSKLMAKEALQ
jgi:3-hydroxybutyryl-CoA dehydrogenase